MSNFYLSAKSDAGKTEVSRRGHKELEAHVRTWDFGVKVTAEKDDDGNNSFRVERTGGSNNPGKWELIGILSEDGWEPYGQFVVVVKGEPF